MLPIFIGTPEAAAIALGLSGEVPPRPITHDLMLALVDSAGAHVERAEVTELRNGTFMAEVELQGPRGARRLDSRPSDAIALAVRVDVPLFVSDDVLDEAGAILSEPVDEQAIDDEVARFRSALDDLDPGKLIDPDPDPDDPDGPSAPGGSSPD